MKKQLLNATLRLVKANGKSKVQVYVTQEVVDSNPNLLMDRGWTELDEIDNDKCPDDSALGYYLKIGGNCVFFPYV